MSFGCSHGKWAIIVDCNCHLFPKLDAWKKSSGTKTINTQNKAWKWKKKMDQFQTSWIIWWLCLILLLNAIIYHMAFFHIATSVVRFECASVCNFNCFFISVFFGCAFAVDFQIDKKNFILNTKSLSSIYQIASNCMQTSVETCAQCACVHAFE